MLAPFHEWRLSKLPQWDRKLLKVLLPPMFFVQFGTAFSRWGSR
jgi:hypothetical protein